MTRNIEDAVAQVYVSARLMQNDGSLGIDGAESIGAGEGWTDPGDRSPDISQITLLAYRGALLLRSAKYDTIPNALVAADGDAGGGGGGTDGSQNNGGSDGGGTDADGSDNNSSSPNVPVYVPPPATPASETDGSIGQDTEEAFDALSSISHSFLDSTSGKKFEEGNKQEIFGTPVDAFHSIDVITWLDKISQVISPSVHTPPASVEMSSIVISVSPGYDNRRFNSKAENRGWIGGAASDEPNQDDPSYQALKKIVSVTTFAMDSTSTTLDAVKLAKITQSGAPGWLGVSSTVMSSTMLYVEEESRSDFIIGVSKNAAIGYASGVMTATGVSAAQSLQFGPYAAAAVGAVAGIGTALGLDNAGAILKSAEVYVVEKMTPYYIELDRNIRNLYPGSEYLSY